MQRRSVLLSCIALVSILLGSCGGNVPQADGAKSPVNAKKKSAITICLLPKIKGISYFSSCYKGAKEAADELGNIELIYDGPTDGDPKKQAEMIEQWTADGVDVICVSTSDPGTVANAMREARKAGIQVITWDADGVPDSRSFFVNQATPQTIGEGMVKAMAKDLGESNEEREVVIISSDPTSANQNAWIDAMKPALEQHKFKLDTIKYPGENASNALADGIDVIKKYPNLKGIFGISSVSFPGSAEAAEQSNKRGEVLVTGLSTPNDMKKFVHNGTVKSVVLWNTIDLGYLTVRVGEALASGKLKTGATTFAAGRLGEKKIAGDSVLLGDILVFTKDNIDQFDF